MQSVFAILCYMFCWEKNGDPCFRVYKNKKERKHKGHEEGQRKGNWKETKKEKWFDKHLVTYFYHLSTNYYVLQSFECGHTRIRPSKVLVDHIGLRTLKTFSVTHSCLVSKLRRQNTPALVGKRWWSEDHRQEDTFSHTHTYTYKAQFSNSISVPVSAKEVFLKKKRTLYKQWS